MAFDIINDVADGLHFHDLIILNGDAELVFQIHDHDHDVGTVCFEIVEGSTFSCLLIISTTLSNIVRYLLRPVARHSIYAARENGILP